MTVSLRLFCREDWDLLLELANQAVPFAPIENAEWFENRKAVDESKYNRRHYIAKENSLPVGYGCLEQQSDDPKWLRIFVVCHPDQLRKDVGELIYEKLFQDANEMGAEHIWAREYQADVPTCDFFVMHGFKEAKRFTLPDQKPMVIYTLDMSR